MSTGSLIGGVIGAVIGFYAGGNVAAGWAIGSAVGGAVDPERIDGPRLNDRSVQVSTQGVSIPIIYGGIAGAGNVIDSTDLRESDVEGGKGGPTVTTHTYSVTCAILIGEPPRGQTIKGVRRIWADAKLVYDAGTTASGSTQAASVIFASYFTFYGGSETQLPDPTLEAVHGVGNVCAYRGCAYIVFNDLPLQDYGNRLPQFRFETSESADEEVTPLGDIYEPLRVGPWTMTDNGPAHGIGDTLYTTAGGVTLSDTNFGTVAAQNAITGNLGANGSGSYSVNYLSYTTPQNNVCAAFGVGATLAPDPEYIQYALAAVRLADVVVIDNGTGAVEEGIPWCGNLHVYGATPADGVTYWTDDSRVVGGYLTRLNGSDPEFGVLNNCVNYPGTVAVKGNFITSISGVRVPAIPANSLGCMPGDPCVAQVPTQVPGQPSFCINCDGEITPRVSVTWAKVSGTYKQLAAIEYRSGALYQNGLGPVLLPSDPNYSDSAFWESQRDQAVLAGTMRSDLSYPVTVSEVAKGTRGSVTSIQAEEATTTLDAIVSDLCVRSGMAPSLFNVTALAGIQVQGYAVSRQMPARAAIEPLQQTFWWDFVESERKLKAVLRGAAPAITIGLDDLGATEGEDMPLAVVPNRGQEAELPATVEVSYSSRASGYETSTQRARRTTTGSKQTVNIEVAVVMSDQRAADVADVLMYTDWTSRTSREWSTTRKFTKYEPTDIWQIDDGEFVYRVRAIDKSEEGPVIKWKGVDDKPAAYSPSATPAGSGTGVGGVRYDGPMKLELIDCPIVADGNDDAGHYAAAAGYRPSWAGGSAFQSRDAGATFDFVRKMTIKATMGYATSALGAWAGGNQIDEQSSVTIRMHSGTLQTINQNALLNGANLAILGKELFQFKRAELLAPGVYLLTGLLRGRKGTEQHTDSHDINDRFVLFSTSSVYRLPGELAELGASQIWKGVTTGQTLDDATPVDFINTGAGLKPLAPAHLHAIPLANGQRLVRCTRRTRIGGIWRDGVDVPLGEAGEGYQFDLVNTAGDVVATSGTVSSPEWKASGALSQSYLLGRVGLDVRLVGTVLAALREPASPTAGAVDTFNPASGVVLDGQPFGEQGTQLADDGAFMFAAAINGSLPSHVFRFDAASLAAPTHTYTGTLAADCQGVAFDGTFLWISESFSSRVRKLVAADLSVISTFAVSGGPARLFRVGASLWACCSGGADVAEISTATGAVTQRIAIGSIPLDVVASGGFIFVQTGTAIRSYAVSTAALVQSEAIGAFSNVRPQHLTLFDGYAIGVDLGTSELVYLSASTGEYVKRVFVDKLLGVSGSDGTRLFIKVSAPPLGVGTETRAFTQGDFTAFKVRAYQLSSTVGRGFAAELEL